MKFALLENCQLLLKFSLKAKQFRNLTVTRLPLVLNNKVQGCVLYSAAQKFSMTPCLLNNYKLLDVQFEALHRHHKRQGKLNYVSLASASQTLIHICMT